MHKRAERQKEAQPTRREEDAADNGQVDDMVYVAKLKHSGRPRKLTAAVLVLLLAMRQTRDHSATALRFALVSPVRSVATQIAAWLTTRLGVPVDADTIAAELLSAIVEYAVKAVGELSGNALRARLGLIVQAETQRATAAAVQRAAQGLGSITRMATSDKPCDECSSLEGTYTPPYPADLWYSHPRCSCVWSVA